MLLAERVRDVLANPEAYEDAFPVSEPPSEQEMLNHWFNQIAIEPLRGLSEEALGAQLTPELLEHTRQIMLSTPFSRDSVASRIAERGYDVPLPSLQNGEPITNAVCTRCGRPRQCVQRRRSTFGPPVEYSAEITDPDPLVAVCGGCLARAERMAYNSYNRLPRWGGESVTSTSIQALRREMTRRTANRILDQYRGRFEQMVYGDGHGEPADRPAHYRVRGGECACGFRTIFLGDMELHLREANGGRREP